MILTKRIKKRSWFDFVPAIGLLIVSAGGILAAGLSPTGDRGQYAVVAPPWYDLTQTVGLVAKAGGDIIAFGGIANVVIAHSESADFVRMIYRAGAWLVIDPVALRGCLGFASDSSRMPRNR